MILLPAACCACMALNRSKCWTVTLFKLYILWCWEDQGQRRHSNFDLSDFCKDKVNPVWAHNGKAEIALNKLLQSLHAFFHGLCHATVAFYVPNMLPASSPMNSCLRSELLIQNFRFLFVPCICADRDISLPSCFFLVSPRYAVSESTQLRNEQVHPVWRSHVTEGNGIVVWCMWSLTCTHFFAVTWY